jgi:predicted aldo/keto reductase-like oxidoreductase
MWTPDNRLPEILMERLKMKEIKRMGRRNFIKAGASTLVGAAMLPPFLNGKDTKSINRSGKKDNFIYRKLGKTGLELPIVSMGVMNSDNPNLVAAALDAGIVYLDTAHGYQRGKNEEMIGQVIKDRNRDSFVIGTKIPYPKDRKTGMYLPETSVESFQEKFDISLKRLGLDYVDILYIHNVSVRETVFCEPAMKFLEKAKKEGKARFGGFSTHENEHKIIQAAVESKSYDVILTAYNFQQKNRTELQKAIAKAAEAGIGIVAMKTQAGVYWDKEEQKPINMKAALKWALQNENIHTSIPGMTAFDQLELDISVMEDLTLTQEERKDLRLDESQTLAGLYCQQCDVCRAQCPAAVDIPTFMRSYMYAYGYRNTGLAQETMNSMEFSQIACSECTNCRVRCTMGFDVRSKILDITRLKDVPREFLV